MKKVNSVKLQIKFKDPYGLVITLTNPDIKVSLDKQISRDALATNLTQCSKQWLTWIEQLAEHPQLSELLTQHSQLLFDLHTHNTYHRGQLNEILTSLGYKPDSLDIFLYKNQ